MLELKKNSEKTPLLLREREREFFQCVRSIIN